MEEQELKMQKKLYASMISNMLPPVSYIWADGKRYVSIEKTNKIKEEIYNIIVK